MTRFSLCLFVGLWLLPAFGQEKPALPIPQLLQKAKDGRSDTSKLKWQLRAAYAYVLKKGEEPVDLDSAMLLVDQVKTANERIHDQAIEALCYMVYSHVYRELKRPDLGKKNALLAIDDCSKLPDSLELGFALMEAATYYNYDNVKEDEVRVGFYRRAVPIFEHAGRKEDQAAALELLGDCLSVAEPVNYVEALQAMLQALKLYNAIGHTALANLYTLLAQTYSSIGDERNAINYGLMAVRQEEERPEGPGLCAAYNRLGLVFYRFEDFPNAETWFRKARPVAIHLKDTLRIIQIGFNIVNSVSRQRRYKESLQLVKSMIGQYPFNKHNQMLAESIHIVAYSELGYLDSARPYAERFKRMSDSMALDDQNRVHVDGDIVRYELKARQYELARKDAQRYRSFLIRNQRWPALVSLYYDIFRIDSGSHEFGTAVDDYQRYTTLKDSLLRVANSKQIAALTLDYETEKKDKNIAVLTREQAMGRAALHQADLTRNGVVAGSVLLLVLLVVSYNRYRIKRRSNYLLQLQAEAIDFKNHELQQLNHSQTKLLNEKEWLLKEIHHRVKNNLQMAMSLLNTQSFYLENEKAIAAITQSRNRMYAMSLIHQRLYQTDNLELIDMSRYIPELVEYIKDSASGNGLIFFETRVDPIRLDVAQAVPIGLVVNEAVTNSIKYAFPGRIGGTIRVLLQQVLDDQVLLEIADDGVGLGDDFDLRSTRSMGMLLIDSLNQQLEGRLEIQSGDGLIISITFPHLSERDGLVTSQFAENGVTSI
jgi:two-component system, sensor histidine kinase PdtaS